MDENKSNQKISLNHDYSFKAENVGMADGELIGYCYFRIDTPRGLVNKHQIARLIFLGGEPEGFSSQKFLDNPTEWYACGTSNPENRKVLEVLIKKAEDVREKKTIVV